MRPSSLKILQNTGSVHIIYIVPSFFFSLLLLLLQCNYIGPIKGYYSFLLPR